MKYILTEVFLYMSIVQHLNGRTGWLVSVIGKGTELTFVLSIYLRFVDVYASPQRHQSYEPTPLFARAVLLRPCLGSA